MIIVEKWSFMRGKKIHAKINLHFFFRLVKKIAHLKLLNRPANLDVERKDRITLISSVFSNIFSCFRSTREYLALFFFLFCHII